MTRYRQAKRSDRAAIVELWCEYMDFHVQFDPVYERSRNAHKKFAKVISDRITSKNGLVLVADDNGEICGYLNGSIAEKAPVFKLRRYGSISDLAVTASKRRSGIGCRLYELAVDWFKKKKVDRIELGVTATNQISNAFWQKMGYEVYYKKLYTNIGMAK